MLSRVMIVLLVLSLPFAALAQDKTAADQNEQFFAAARKGDVEAVKALLAKGTDVNAKTRYGVTALYYAADRGHMELVKLLLEKGADVNVRDTFYGSTALGAASDKGHPAIVKALIDKGANGKTEALMTGVYRNNVDVVKVVLDSGTVPAQTLSLALGTAEQQKYTEVAELLKKAGAVPPPKADFQIDAATLATYAGTYRPAQGADFKFVLKDGKLTGGPVGQDPLTLGAIDKTTFRPGDIVAVTITFNVEGGRVTGFTLKQGETSRVFQKVE